MANETRIGNLVIDLQLKTQALEKGLKTAQEKLKQMENTTNNNTVKFAALSAAGVFAINGITNAIKEGINAYVQYSNSLKSVQAIATNVGISMKEVNNAIKQVNELKLMDEADVNSAIKNLLTYGYTTQQAVDILKTLQDVAVDNRQSHYSFSEAIRVTTEGIRMENSVLSDAAGIQKNIAKMYAEYAKSIGKSTDALTQAEKAQAVYNGIMAESEAYIGRAKEVSDELSGSQAQYDTATKELSRTLGETFAPVLKQILEIVTPLIKSTSDLIKNNSGLSAGILTLVTVVGSLTIALKGLIALFPALSAALGPAGWVIAGLSLIASALVAIQVETQKTTESINNITKSMQNAQKALENFKIDNDVELINVQNERDRVQEIIKQYDELDNKLNQLHKDNDYTLLHPTTARETVNELARIKKEIENTEKAMEKLLTPVDGMVGMNIDALRNKIKTYNNVIDSYNSEKKGIEDEVVTTKSSAYKNTALENYKKQIEYKKNLDKLSAEEEIEMYEYALKKLAKISDEKMDLEVKIYQLKKELSNDYVMTLEEELQKRRDNSEAWITEQKELNNMSLQEELSAYDRIIAYHKEYLDTIINDMKISSEEKDRIWLQETKNIKSYLQKQRELQVENINKVYSNLKEAIVSNLEELEETELNSLNQRRNSLNAWKKEQIDSVNEIYDAKIQTINDELKALEKAEKQKTRLDEKAEYEKQRTRLEELIAYEHDVVTKSSYQKELNKLNANYEKELEEQRVDDLKESLKTEIEQIEETKKLKLDSINDEYNKTKELYDAIESETITYYQKQIENADRQAEQMLLNIEDNNEEIINLLQTYTDEYELIGASWGEKLATAFEEKVVAIMETIQTMQNRIDSAINGRLAVAYNIGNGSGYSGITGYEHLANANTTIVQNNNYNVAVERPSSLAQKQKESCEQLAEQVRSVL